MILLSSSSSSAGSDSDNESSSGSDSDTDADESLRTAPKRARQSAEPSQRPRAKSKLKSTAASQTNSKPGPPIAALETNGQVEARAATSNRASSLNSQSTSLSLDRPLHSLGLPEISHSSHNHKQNHKPRASKRPARKVLATSYSPPTGHHNGVSVTISISKPSPLQRQNGLSAPACPGVGVGVGPGVQPGSPTSSVPSLGELSSGEDTLSDSPVAAAAPPPVNHFHVTEKKSDALRCESSSASAPSQVLTPNHLSYLQPTAASRVHSECSNSSSQLKQEPASVSKTQSESLPTARQKAKPRARPRAKSKAQAAPPDASTAGGELDAASSPAAKATATAESAGAVAERKPRKRARDRRKRPVPAGGADDPFGSQSHTDAALDALLARVQSQRPSSRSSASAPRSRAATAGDASAPSTGLLTRAPARPVENTAALVPIMPAHCCVCLGDSSVGILQRCALCSLTVHSGTSP